MSELPDDEVLMYLGDADCASQCPLFPDRQVGEYSRQSAKFYSDRYKNTGDAVYAMKSMQYSVKFNHPLEASISDWLLDSTVRYFDDEKVADVFELKKGQGSQSQKGNLIAMLRHESILINLAVLLDVFDFGSTDARKLLYSRDYTHHDGSGEVKMVRKNFNKLCKVAEDELKGMDGHERCAYHELLSIDDSSVGRAIEYLETFRAIDNNKIIDEKTKQIEAAGSI